jgi:hypothetical protein
MIYTYTPTVTGATTSLDQDKVTAVITPKGLILIIAGLQNQ